MVTVNALIRIVLRLAFAAQLTVNFVRRPRVCGAHVAIIWNDRILVVKNSYRRGLGMPAGQVGRFEDIRDAARQELREEVGLDLPTEALQPDSMLTVIHEWKTDEAHVFVAHLDEEPDVTVDRREVLWARFMTRAELDQEPQHAVLTEWLARRDRKLR